MDFPSVYPGKKTVPKTALQHPFTFMIKTTQHVCFSANSVKLHRITSSKNPMHKQYSLEHLYRAPLVAASVHFLQIFRFFSNLDPIIKT